MCDDCPDRWWPSPRATHPGCAHPYSKHREVVTRTEERMKCDARRGKCDCKGSESWVMERRFTCSVRGCGCAEVTLDRRSCASLDRVSAEFTPGVWQRREPKWDGEGSHPRLQPTYY